MLPPPVQYPKRRRWPLFATIAAVIAVIAAVATVVVVVGGRSETRTPITAATAQPAIQEFLDALADGDEQTIARHTLCGLYDAVKNHDSDLALADMSGDAFRKQYKNVQVTSIDKIVYLSPDQAQVLFSMKGTPAPSGRMPASTGDEHQAVAQLLAQDNRILVCSYVQRTD
ncbi:Rv0361 family membrane protein [Mycobacterium sp. BMJ-28]